jgi:hypothetical protein
MASEGHKLIYVPISKLPKALTAQAHAYIRARSVTMIATETRDDRNAAPCAATLVDIRGRRGLLTARHVWEKIKKMGVLAVVIGDQVLRIAESSLSADAPPTNPNRLRDAEVPDIAFIRLAPALAAEIEARGRVFYSIDKRRQLENVDLERSDGFLVLAGSPIERMDLDAGRVASFLYDTNAGASESQDGWDYTFVNLNIESNPEIPESLKGVSGGGLWRVIHQVSADKSEMWIENESTDILLVGVNFYQTPMPQSQLICHGPRSIYNVLTELVDSAA